MATPSTPDYEPTEFVAGETVEWTKQFDGFTPGDGWALKYYFRNAAGGGFDITATANGSGWKVSTIIPANTAVGRIDWQAWVEKVSDKRLVEEGRSQVKPSLAAIAANIAHDGRTQAEKDLEKVRAALVGNVEALEYQIGNRTLRRFSKEELIKLEHNLVVRVASERRAARLRDGAPFFTNIQVRFK